MKISPYSNKAFDELSFEQQKKLLGYQLLRDAEDAHMWGEQ